MQTALVGFSLTRSQYLVLGLVIVTGGCSSGSARVQPTEADAADDGVSAADVAAQAADAIADVTTQGMPDVLSDVAADKDTNTIAAEAGRDQAADSRKADTPLDLAQDSGAGGKADSGGTGGSTGHVSVLQHHNNASRDGFYVDPALKMCP
jgi:hypothetical protein